jgi:hypothetical protein
MPALLMQAAEERMLPFECGKCLQRVRDSTGKPLGDRRQQQRIALFRHPGKQGFSRSHGGGEPVRTQQAAYGGEFGVYRR